VPENAEQLSIVEGVIRKHIELKRFDYNNISLRNVYTIDQFVNELREFVKKRAVDRASAEAEFEARFKQARIYARDIERILNSAYFYIIKVYALKVKRGVCPEKKAAALVLGCVPGTEGMIATVNATVTFYRANLLDETKPPYEKVREVRHSITKDFETLVIEEVQPEHRAAHERKVGNAALTNATTTLAMFLSKGMKQIPAFQLKTPVTAALSDGVEFMLGKQAGVRLDDTYDVTEFDAGGKKTILGYVKVRDIGDAKATGEGSPSYAEKVKEKRKFVGGEQLYEHAMVGFSLGLALAFEFTLQDVITHPDEEEKSGLYPGVALYADYNLAPHIGLSEFYTSVELDWLYIPNDLDINVSLVHAMLGFKKKWYIESLVFSVGLRGGISYYVVEDYEDDAIGFGGDLWAGLEYYFKPEFSIYLKAAGRFFTNPLLLYAGGEDMDPELGAQAQLGAFLAL
jgi:hypothetical protein